MGLSMFNRISCHRLSCQILLSVLLLSTIAWVGCSPRSGSSGKGNALDPNRTIVQIGAENYTAAQFDDFLRERFPETTNPIPRNDEVMSELLDRAINERLLLQEARQQGVTVSDKDVQEYLSNSSLIQNLDLTKLTAAERQRRVERAREILMVDRFLQSLATGQKPVLASEVKQYYEAHLDSFQEPEQFHVEEILVKDEPLAEAIEERLNKRQSFASLAQKYSQNPVASKRGDLGWFARGELPEQFEKAVMALKSGQHSPIIKTDYGFHIFRLKEIRKGHLVSLQTARPQIEKILGEEKRKEIQVNEITRLRQSTPIRIELQNLGFKYSTERSGE